MSLVFDLARGYNDINKFKRRLIMADSQAKHGGSKKIGRNKNKCAAYRSAKTAEHHKAKRVLQSSGPEAYKEYCKNSGITLSLLDGYYARIAGARNVA